MGGANRGKRLMVNSRILMDGLEETKGEAGWQRLKSWWWNPQRIFTKIYSWQKAPDYKVGFSKFNPGQPKEFRPFPSPLSSFSPLLLAQLNRSERLIYLTARKA